MRIEVLHIDDCPNWQEAGRRLSAALAATGNGDAAASFTLLRTSEDASRVAFAGSPTITVDGADLFPTGARTTDLACRIYPTPDGLAGMPTVDQLITALERRGDLETPCSCCGRSYPRRRLHEVGGSGTLICRRCGLWVAFRLRGDRL